MLRRRLREVVLLLMTGARRQLLCATAPGSQAHGGRKHRDPSKNAADPDISESAPAIFESSWIQDQMPQLGPSAPNERRRRTNRY